MNLGKQVAQSVIEEGKLGFGQLIQRLRIGAVSLEELRLVEEAGELKIVDGITLSASGISQGAGQS